MQLNYDGVLIAALTLAAIAFGHVFVRNAYRLCGARIWPVSLFLGLGLLGSNLFATHPVHSGGLAVWGATFVWAVKEILEMKERVE